jgi:hypothetical protein
MAEPMPMPVTVPKSARHVHMPVRSALITQRGHRSPTGSIDLYLPQVRRLSLQLLLRPVVELLVARHEWCLGALRDEEG